MDDPNHCCQQGEEAAAEAFRTYLESNVVPSTSLIAQGAMAMIREGMTPDEVATSLEFFAGYLRTKCFATLMCGLAQPSSPYRDGEVSHDLAG